MKKRTVLYTDARTMRPDERRKLLCDTYTIDEGTFENLVQDLHARSISELREIFIDIAKVIYEAALLQSNDDKNRALTQLSTTNLSLALPFEKDTRDNFVIVRGKIQSCFEAERKAEEQRLGLLGLEERLTNTHPLRDHAFERVHGYRLSSNIELSHRIWNHTPFSNYDLLHGHTLPEQIDKNMAFLLGVYRATGYITKDTSKSYTFTITGGRRDTSYYTEVLVPLLNGNLHIHPNMPKRGGEIRIESKLHYFWLQNSLLRFGEQPSINFEKMSKDVRQEDTEELFKYYFLGMFSCAAQPNRCMKFNPFRVHERGIVQEIYEAAKKTEFEVTRPNPYAYITRRTAEQIRDSPFDLQIHESWVTATRVTIPLQRTNGKKNNGHKVVLDTVGGFIHPVHVEYMRERYQDNHY